MAMASVLLLRLYPVMNLGMAMSPVTIMFYPCYVKKAQCCMLNL